jgi:hypothetical protein
MKSLLVPSLACCLLLVCPGARAIELISAQTRGHPNAVTVVFSDDVTEASATNAANYAVDNGVIVSNVVMLETGKVRLFTTPLPEGQVYTLTVNGVQDRATPASTIAPDSKIAFLQTQGALLRKEFDNIAGGSVSDLTNNPNFPNVPNSVTCLTSLEAPENVGDNYGQQIEGLLTAPLTGDYTFYLASDDQGALYLSTDENPANQALIAAEPGWNPSRLWIGNLNGRLQTTTNFIAGDFFIEAEDFDFGGGQHQVAADTMPYPGGAYVGLSAVAEIDYHDPGASESVAYRAADQGVAIRSNPDLSRGLFTVTTNFQVGWNDPGDWYNYTRTFPTPGQDYYVLARLASGGADMAARLDAVIAGAGTTNQTTAKLGEFQAPATSTYDLFTFAPLRDDLGNLAIVHLEGQTVLRFTVLPGSLDFDYLAFQPASAGPPDLDQLRPKNISAPIHLEAGAEYYLEALMKENSGDDHVAATWRKPGDPEPTNGAPPIDGQFLSMFNQAVVPAAIVQPPAGQTVDEFGSVTFNVGLSGTPPFDYQWLSNGVMIPGANGPNCTVTNISATDNGAVFSVLTGNGISSVRANAVLSVNPDLTPPVLLSAEGSPGFDMVTLRFSERINATDASTAANFTLSGGLTVDLATLLADGRTVILHTSPQTPGTVYTLAVNGVRDISTAANVISPNSQASFTAFVLSQGFLRQEIYAGTSGTSLSDLTNDPAFPDRPDAVNFVTQFESPSTYQENYAVRLSGYLLPPVTGDYVLYLNSDDQGALFLSTDDDPAHKAEIASEPGWNPPRQWINGANQGSRGNPPANISAPVQLEAGQKYYVEALMKQGAGADNLAVTWRAPSGPEVRDFDAPISGAYLATYANPDSAALTITQQPQSATVPEQQAVTLSILVAASSPEVFYQWQKDGVDITGATAPRYVTPPLALADGGASYRCLVCIPGASVTSDPATLAVTADTTLPTIVSAEGNLNLNQVTIGFSETVSPADATNLLDFGLSGGLSVTDARLGGDGKSVLLYTSPQTSGAQYTVTVNGMHDTAAAANLIVPDSQVSFVGWAPEEFVGPFPSWADVKRDYGAVGDGIADDTAALQQALDDLGNSTQPLYPILTNHPYVLYLPAGTYRITQGLEFKYRIAVSVAGEDPTTTFIVWDGAAGGVMLHCNGVSEDRVTRLTFDGAGVALSAIDHKWDGSNQPSATSGSEYSDLIIKDAQFGIRAGVDYNDGEVAVLRCQFLRCSQIAVSMESYNAVDWWVWNSSFDTCRVGVANTVKAGICNVYQSLFRNSTEADLEIGGWLEFISFRNNQSIGSKAFLTSDVNNGSIQATVQGNTIIDPQDSLAINLNRPGPLLLLDNIFQSRAGLQAGPVVYLGDNLVSIGNTFTVSSPLSCQGRVQSIDDQTVDRLSLTLSPLAMPGFLPNLHRPILEVPAGADAAGIQAVIDAAVPLTGQRPIVHLPPGVFPIDRTLVIPAGCDLQLVGDGIRAATCLQWVGEGPGPVLRLDGPSRATLRELTVNGANLASGIVVENCDQPAARVFMEQVSLAWSSNNLVINRLDETDVSLHDFGHGSSSQVSFQVIGGPRQAAGQATGGRVVLFGGASSGNELSYDLSDYGSLLAQDIWYEGSQPRFVHLGNSGAFTLNGAKIQRYSYTNTPAVQISGFHGDVTLLTSMLEDSQVVIDGDGGDTRVLGLGLGAFPGFFTNVSAHAQVELLSSNGESESVPDQGQTDPEFIKSMLRQTRQERPRLLTPRPDGVTDARFYRLLVWQCSVGIQLNRGPLVITQQPQDQTVTEFEPVSFQVEAAGLSPSYQWFQNGLPISDGTNLSLFLPAVQFADQGSQFNVVVSNVLGSITSSNATLTVIPDLTPPAIISARANGSPPTQVEVIFSKAVEEITGTNAAFYSLGDGIQVSNAIMGATPNIVWLTTSPMNDGRQHVLTLNGVTDRSAHHNPIAPNSRVAVSFELATLVDYGQIVNGFQDDFSAATLGSNWVAVGGEVNIYSVGGGVLSVTTPQGWLDHLLYEAPGYDATTQEVLARIRIAVCDSDRTQAGIGVGVESHGRGIDYVFKENALDDPFTGVRDAANSGPSWPFPWQTNVWYWMRLKQSPDYGPGKPDVFGKAWLADGSVVEPSDWQTWDYVPASSVHSGFAGIAAWGYSGSFSEFDVDYVLIKAAGLPPVLVNPELTFGMVPVNTPIPDRYVDEGATLTFIALSSDPNLPAQSLTYTLGAGAPEGASIDPMTGQFTWTPSEAQGPSTNRINVVVSNDGSPALRSTNRFTVVVKEVNMAPLLGTIAAQSVNELTLLTVTNAATESNIHSTLGYALVNPPAGMGIDTNGVITWTPQQTQSPGTNLVTTFVTNSNPYDLVNPHLSATNAFTVIVKEVNAAPVLPVIGTQTVNELTLLTVSNTATESNIHSTLDYALVNPPAGMAIDTNGVITWTPQQSQSPGTNLVTTLVTNSNPYDLVNPHLSATNTFTVIVNEVNVAPVLPVIGAQTVNELTLLTVTNTASESNIHSTLGYSLLNPPAGMSIDTNGIITWTPQQSQSPSTNLVTTLVTNSNPYDLVNPHQSAANTFTVIVKTVNAPELDIVMVGGQPQLTWSAVAGWRYQVWVKQELANTSWTSVGGVLTASAETLEFTDSTTSGTTARFYRVQVLGPQ